jgi:hypothetical protein
MVIKQLCCEPSENVDPGGSAQVSSSVKLGSWLKSLQPKGLGVPDWGLNDSDRSLKAEPDGSMLVRVMICDVGADPTPKGEKLRDAGDNRIGCVQPVGSFPNARQIFPRSPGRFPPGQALVVTP